MAELYILLHHDRFDQTSAYPFLKEAETLLPDEQGLVAYFQIDLEADRGECVELLGPYPAGVIPCF